MWVQSPGSVPPPPFLFFLLFLFFLFSSRGLKEGFILFKFGNRFRNPNVRKECSLNPASKARSEDFEALSGGTFLPPFFFLYF